MAKMSPLRRRMIEEMTLRNLSRQTQQSYIYAVAKFSRHFNRPPNRLGMDDVRAYQLHLIGQKYSWSHVNQVACALRFFYGITLDQKEAFERIITGKHPEKLLDPVSAAKGTNTRFVPRIVSARTRLPARFRMFAIRWSGTASAARGWRVNNLLARQMFWQRLTAMRRVTLAFVASRRRGRFGDLFGSGTALGHAFLELAEEKLELFDFPVKLLRGTAVPRSPENHQLSLEIFNLKRLGVEFRIANGDDPFTLVKLLLLLGNDALAFRNRSIPLSELLPQ
jgi:hypothetical protein